jgi:hypothetical protein
MSPGNRMIEVEPGVFRPVGKFGPLTNADGEVVARDGVNITWQNEANITWQNGVAIPWRNGVNIAWQMGVAEGGTQRPARIVIDLGPQDDPDGHIADLLVGGDLAAFLRLYARAGDFGGAASADEAYRLLAGFGHITALCNMHLDDLQLAARDQWRMGWGQIAEAVHSARSTVRDRIQAARKRCAEVGHWYDVGGFHRGSPEAARSAALAAWDRDAQEPSSNQPHRPELGIFPL